MSTVYVLGAGASKGLNQGAPLMPQLLGKALEFSLDRRQGTISAPHARDVKAFLEDFYGSTDACIPPFEDVLSLFDYCIGNNVPLSGDYSVDKLRQLRQKLIYIMGRVLQEEMDRRTDEPLAGSFVSRVRDEDSIVSLNYDLIVDNALRRLVGRTNYHIPIRNHQFYPSPLHVPGSGIYKLHGSLNWLYCPVCREIYTTDHRKEGLEALARSVLCEECETPLEVVLITPTYLKNYGNSFISQLWHKAQQKLQHAEQVVFVGYSLPEADIDLRIFLTRALYANRVIRNRPCEITVVDRAETDENDVSKRYEQLFGSVHYYRHGFEKYILEVMRQNQ